MENIRIQKIEDTTSQILQTCQNMEMSAVSIQGIIVRLDYQQTDTKTIKFS